MRNPRTNVATALLVLAACSGDGYKPTAPRTPAPPDPTPPTPITGEATATGTYTVELWDADAVGEREVQVFLDGAVLCTGPLVSDPWNYDGVCDHGRLGTLAAGRHELAVRIIRQKASPTTYDVDVSVALVLRANGVPVKQRRESWQESITLATGDSWRGAFRIREWD